MFYTLIHKFINIFSELTPDKEISEEFINKDDLDRESTRDFYEDLGRPY
jgi:hypothetical protein